MRRGLAGPHRESGVEQQHTLTRPVLEIAVAGYGTTQIVA